MGTPFNEIYVQFLSQVKVFEFANVFENLENAETPEEIEKAEKALHNLEQNMQYWLMSSIGHFGECSKDLRLHNLEAESFLIDLDFDEINILSKFMAYAYLLTEVITETNIKQTLNSKDYRMYSSANHLKALEGLRDSLFREANSLKSKYYYKTHSIKDLFKWIED